MPNGIPRTNAERRIRHKKFYGEEALPKRGTGRVAGESDQDNAYAIAIANYKKKKKEG